MSFVTILKGEIYDMTNSHNIDISLYNETSMLYNIEVHFCMKYFEMKYLLIGKHFNL